METKCWAACQCRLVVRSNMLRNQQIAPPFRLDPPSARPLSVDSPNSFESSVLILGSPPI